MSTSTGHEADIVVLEVGPTIGGMTSTYATNPGAPRHLANEGAIQQSLIRMSSIEQDLDLKHYGLREIPADPGAPTPRPPTASHWRSGTTPTAPPASLKDSPPQGCGRLPREADTLAYMPRTRPGPTCERCFEVPIPNSLNGFGIIRK